MDDENPAGSDPEHERERRVIDLGKLAREQDDNDGARPESVSGWPPPDADDSSSQGKSTFNPMYDVADHPTAAVQLQPGGLGCARIAVAVPLLFGWLRRKRRE